MHLGSSSIRRGAQPWSMKQDRRTLRDTTVKEEMQAIALNNRPIYPHKKRGRMPLVREFSAGEDFLVLSTTPTDGPSSSMLTTR